MPSRPVTRSKSRSSASLGRSRSYHRISCSSARRRCKQCDELAPFHCLVPPVLPDGEDSTGLLRCGISICPMSAEGQTEKSRQRDGTAGLPSTADMLDECRHGRFVPLADICDAAKDGRNPSFNHLVSAGEQSRRHDEASARAVRNSALVKNFG